MLQFGYIDRFSEEVPCPCPEGPENDSLKTHISDKDVRDVRARRLVLPEYLQPFIDILIAVKQYEVNLAILYDILGLAEWIYLDLFIREREIAE